MGRIKNNMDLSIINKLIKEKQIKWSQHILYRMQQRNIKIKDVLHSIKNGEIIETYEDDEPYSSCLIFGYTIDDKIIHTVCAIGENKLWMITTYYPDSDEWDNNLKKRR